MNLMIYFFQKIDEIDDLIVEGENLDFILNRFNLESSKSATFNDIRIKIKTPIQRMIYQMN